MYIVGAMVSERLIGLMRVASSFVGAFPDPDYITVIVIPRVESGGEIGGHASEYLGKNAGTPEQDFGHFGGGPQIQNLTIIQKLLLIFKSEI